MRIEDLLVAHGDTINAYRDKAVNDARAGEADRTSAAVSAALEAERAKKPPAATLAELRAAVPEKMEGRDGLILSLLEKNATVAQAHAEVSTKLDAQNVELRAKLAEVQKVDGALGGAGRGGNALRLSTAIAKPGEETYMSLVEEEMAKLVDKGKSEHEAKAMAMAKVSRERRDLLEAHNEELREQARANVIKARTGKTG